MHKGQHWEDKRTVEAVRLIQLIEEGNIHNYEEMRTALARRLNRPAFPKSRCAALVRHTRDPKVPIVPVAWIDGLWHSAKTCPMLYERYDKEVLAPRELGVQRARANNLQIASSEAPEQAIAIVESIAQELAQKDALLTAFREMPEGYAKKTLRKVFLDVVKEALPKRRGELAKQLAS